MVCGLLITFPKQSTWEKNYFFRYLQLMPMKVKTTSRIMNIIAYKNQKRILLSMLSEIDGKGKPEWRYLWIIGRASGKAIEEPPIQNVGVSSPQLT